MRMTERPLLVLCLALLPAPASAQDLGHIAGVVLDSVSEPIGGVTVQLGGIEAGTDQRGRFRIEGVRPGTYILEFSRLGYASASDTVEVAAGEVAVVTVRLREVAIPLDTLEARAERAARGEAMRRGTRTRVLTRAQIDSLAPQTSSMGEIVRRLPGLLVQSGGQLGQPVCAEAVQRSAHTGGCDMVLLVVDGITYEGYDAQDVLGTISPSDVDRVEFFSASEAGLRFGRRAGNGVLEIRTRQGQRVPDDRRQAQRIALARATGATPGRIIVGSALGATLGYLGGALAGAAAVPDEDFFSGAGLGAVVGTTITTPLGTHLAGEGQGSLWLKLLTSGVVGGVGVAGIDATNADAVFAILVPIAQVAIVSWLEIRVLAR